MSYTAAATAPPISSGAQPAQKGCASSPIFRQRDVVHQHNPRRSVLVDVAGRPRRAAVIALGPHADPENAVRLERSCGGRGRHKDALRQVDQRGRPERATPAHPVWSENLGNLLPPNPQSGPVPDTALETRHVSMARRRGLHWRVSAGSLVPEGGPSSPRIPRGTCAALALRQGEAA
eukprot:1997767-Rhodomonas_salina.1